MVMLRKKLRDSYAHNIRDSYLLVIA